MKHIVISVSILQVGKLRQRKAKELPQINRLLHGRSGIQAHTVEL